MIINVLSKNIKEKLTIVPVKWIDQVFEHALAHLPVPDASTTSSDDKQSTPADESSSKETVRPH